MTAELNFDVFISTQVWMSELKVDDFQIVSFVVFRGGVDIVAELCRCCSHRVLSGMLVLLRSHLS